MRYRTPLDSSDHTAVRACLLPLSLAVIWAFTALSVEVSPPSLDGELWRPGLVDILVNVALYVPLGIGLRRRGMVGAIVVAAVLSATVEGIQLFYPDRYTAVTDLVANVGGAVLGWWVSNRFGRRSAWGLDPVVLTGRISLFGLFACVVLASILSVPGRRSDFSNWDPECRLIAGDELTRERRWSGDIDLVAVFDECLRSKDIGELGRRGIPPADDFTPCVASPVFFARLSTELDSIRGVPLLGSSDQGLFFDALVGAGRLSVLTWFRTSAENQGGPARIFGFSKSPWAQNFSLGQEGRQIVFRLRTPTTSPGGFHPQTTTRPVLDSDVPTFVAGTYDGRVVRVFIDGRFENRLNLSARGKPLPFFTDGGLPASAALVGMLAALFWVVGARRSGFDPRVWGAFGGFVGGVVLVTAGGVQALPEFAVWVPVLSAWGGGIVGCAVGPF